MEPLALYLVEYAAPDDGTEPFSCVVRAHSLEEAFAIWRYDMIHQQGIFETLDSGNRDHYADRSATVSEIGTPLTDKSEILPLREFTYYDIAHTSAVTLAVDAHLYLNATTVGN